MHFCTFYLSIDLNFTSKSGKKWNSETMHKHKHAYFNVLQLDSNLSINLIKSIDNSDLEDGKFKEF